MSRRRPSIRGCLTVLGIIIPSKESIELFVDCNGDLEKEFSTLKKIYFRKILKEHPDKGGDPNEFRKTRSAFEILREKRTNNELFFSFLDEEELTKDENGNGNNKRSSDDNDIPFDQDDFFRKEAERGAKQGDVPSYEYYYEAAQETVPGYRVELAKSGRSRCQKCNRDATRKKKKNSKNKNRNTKTTGTGTGTGGAVGVGAVKKENPTPKPPPSKEDPSPSPPTAASQEQEQPSSTATALVVVVVPTGGSRQTRAMTRAACRTSTAVTLKNLPPTTATTATTATATATATTTVTAKKATKKTTAPTKKKKATAVLAVVADADTAITKYEDTTLIPKDGIRIGSLNEFSGSYGRWHHLPCWRVPYRIWAGLTDPNNKEQVWLDLLSMDEILLTNVSSLVTVPSNKSDKKNAIKNGGNDDDDDDGEEEEVNTNKELFIAHVMDRNNWARKTKSSKPPPDLEQLRKEQDEKMNMKLAVGTTSSEKKRSTPDDDNDGKPAAKTSKGGSKKQKKPKKSTKGSNDSTTTTTTVSTTAIVAVAAAASAVVKAPTIKKAFKIPRPGKDGAADSNLYERKRFVLTGVFPEIGGGIGLDQGKAKVKALVESFGGRVTSAVSGVTDFLIVGRNPGASKVSKAISKNVPRIDLKSLGENIYNTIPSLEQAPTPVITSFSAGYESGRLLQY